MLDRRVFFAICSVLDLTSAMASRLMSVMEEEEDKITRDMNERAVDTIGDEYKEIFLDSLAGCIAGYEEIFGLRIPNQIAPAIVFDPVPAGMKFETERLPARNSCSPLVSTSRVPRNLEDVAFDSVRELAELIRTRKVSSCALTEMYLERLKRYNSALKFVITLTEDRAQAKAREADREIASGIYRGPLHGLPWGAKDLLAVKGYRTTWGLSGFENRVIDEDATVVQRLDASGAVLVAKLSLGALGQGDNWFGGVTRSPWNTKQGSGGSSAGPASATAAGCVAFAIGSETLGSISSPATRCGATGLRPTFGRVPRTGAMTLSWTMDKIGPICRSAEDCALVLNEIHGPDGHDRSVQDLPFNWDANFDCRQLRVGYLRKEFESSISDREKSEPLTEDPNRIALKQKHQESEITGREFAQICREYDRRYEQLALDKLRGMGIVLIPIELPDLPYRAMQNILVVESAAAFEELTHNTKKPRLAHQMNADWIVKAARFIPAVEYIQANRARMLAINHMATIFDQVDVIVAPSTSRQLVLTNLTGHPAVVLPNGFRGDDAPQPRIAGSGIMASGGPGTPVSLTFLGQLYGEAKLLALARAYQDATDFHLKHPVVIAGSL